MNNRDSQAIFESYCQGKVVNIYLTEEEEQQAEVKQQVQQALEKPETQQAVQKTAEELFAKYRPQIDAAKAQGQPAVEKLLQQIQADLTKQVGQQVQKESLDLQEEGWFDRLRSRGAGALRQGKEVMRGGAQPTKGYDTHAVTKRYEILQNTIGKDLRELERDLGTTSNTDTTVKDQVSQMIQTLGTKHNIAPVQSKLGDIRHKVGVVGQNIVTGALMGGALVALAAPVIAAIGLTGPAAAAVGAGFAGSTTSVLKDLIYGQKPDAKRAVAAGLTTALTAGLLKYLFGGAQAGGTQPEPAPVPVPTPSPVEAIKADWPTLSKTVFGRMGLKGAPSGGSIADNTVLKQVIQAVKDRGLDWTAMSMKEKAAIFNPIAKAVLKR